jgi:hypothetical protein
LLRLLLALVLLLLAGQAGGFWLALRERADRDRAYNEAALSRHWQARALRWEARADSLYHGIREVQLGAARYAERMIRAEGERDQCRAQF